MTHAKSLRVIGQSMENAKLQNFELNTDGSNYLAQSDSLDAASEWILRQALTPVSAREPIVDSSVRFTPADIFSYLERARQNDDCSLADGVRLMAGEDKVRGLDIGEAWWQDVDTPEMLLRAEEQMQTLPQFKKVTSLTSGSTVSKGGFRGDQNGA